MTRLKLIREALSELLNRHGNELPKTRLRVAKAFVNQLASHDSKTIDEVLQMLGLLEVSAPSAGDEVAPIVDSLRRILMDERAFPIAVRELAAQRRISKAMLVRVYLDLYRRKRSIRASAPREELVQLLIDERNVLHRYGVLESLARPNNVAAE
jgi:hypothetical protein